MVEKAISSELSKSKGLRLIIFSIFLTIFSFMLGGKDVGLLFLSFFLCAFSFLYLVSTFYLLSHGKLRKVKNSKVISIILLLSLVLILGLISLNNSFGKIFSIIKIS